MNELGADSIDPEKAGDVLALLAETFGLSRTLGTAASRAVSEVPGCPNASSPEISAQLL